MKLLTLGEAAKLTGKSKPTISKAVKDGKISGTKGADGVFQIEVSELLRVYPAKSQDDSKDTPKTSSPSSEVEALKQQHLEEKVNDLEKRLMKAEQERDQAIQDARDDRNKFMALLEHQKPKGLWARIVGK